MKELIIEKVALLERARVVGIEMVDWGVPCVRVCIRGSSRVRMAGDEILPERASAASFRREPGLGLYRAKAEEEGEKDEDKEGNGGSGHDNLQRRCRHVGRGIRTAGLKVDAGKLKLGQTTAGTRQLDNLQNLLWCMGWRIYEGFELSVISLRNCPPRFIVILQLNSEFESSTALDAANFPEKAKDPSTE